ncbi:hypothetical protein [uncultured Roseobacter sp.]|uniref:spike base protein, RCAP_Rcc01079 family n=1 Tax=uncultured Roseobacter sp. TaxID=114847 RepID=UPI00260CF0EF|nr:hypothetical protein [uncultured Roseobacter sp.]
MTDAFAQYQVGLESPATRIWEVTPNDRDDMDEASRAINVATSGTVRITTVDGTTATIYVAAGSAFPVRAARIWNSGTTATDITALA